MNFNSIEGSIQDNTESNANAYEYEGPEYDSEDEQNKQQSIQKYHIWIDF